jgi:hypothetical protein
MKDQEDLIPQAKSFESLPNNDTELLSPHKEIEQMATR